MCTYMYMYTCMYMYNCIHLILIGVMCLPLLMKFTCSDVHVHLSFIVLSHSYFETTLILIIVIPEIRPIVLYCRLLAILFKMFKSLLEFLKNPLLIGLKNPILIGLKNILCVHVQSSKYFEY